ncbi:MAG: ribosomal protein S18-alanine N-acetyltransferase [Nitrospiraceae bacterium]
MIKNPQSSRVHIEPATHHAREQILRIEQESFSAPWTRKMFDAELDGNPFSHLYVARSVHESGAGIERREVVGYVCFWIVFDELRFMNLAVERAARRRGIARELVRHTLAVGRERGAARAVLEVRASNEAARCLYEQAGFHHLAARAEYYTNPIEDAILMGMDLVGGKAEAEVQDCERFRTQPQPEP